MWFFIEHENMAQRQGDVSRLAVGARRIACAGISVLLYVLLVPWAGASAGEILHVEGNLSGRPGRLRTATAFSVTFDFGRTCWTPADYYFSRDRGEVRNAFDADVLVFGPLPKSAIVIVTGYDSSSWDLTDVVYEGTATWVPGTKLTVDVHAPVLEKQIERRLLAAWELARRPYAELATDYIEARVTSLFDGGRDGRAQHRDADAGDPFVQLRLAKSYERSGYFFALAYKWYAIAATTALPGNGNRYADAELARDAAAGRDRVAARLSPDQLMESKKLVDSWRPNLAGCHGSFWVRQKNGHWWNDLVTICDRKTNVFRFLPGSTF